MTITKTLFTGVSGLSAHGKALGVVGDNIANISTTGYKAERAIFADLLGHSMMLTGEPGSGVRMSGISRSFSQGTLLSTDSPTDLAINGTGFFIVRGNNDGITTNFYTRAGQFALDVNGALVNPQGMVLQGYLADPMGVLDTQLTDLTVSNEPLPPNPTTEMNVATNLDSTAIVPPAFDPATPGTTSNFSTAITVYDSLGNAHRVDVYFRKDADNSWTWHALVEGSEIGQAAGPFQAAQGTLGFTTDGLLDTEATTAAWNQTFNGASAQTITFDFGDAITTDGGTGQAGSTQYAAASAIRNQRQDGHSTGELSGIGVQGNGEVMAIYSNGERRLIGQVALATFQAEGELARAGNTLWAQTIESGEARVGTASSGISGSITAGALEQSTVDLAQEFVNLIAYQRAFQANSKTISTADTLYGELVNLKR